MQYYLQNMQNMQVNSICKICKKNMQKKCKICKQYAGFADIAVYCRQYAKYAKYAKYANPIAICKISTPEFADVTTITNPHNLEMYTKSFFACISHFLLVFLLQAKKSWLKVLIKFEKLTRIIKSGNHHDRDSHSAALSSGWRKKKPFKLKNRAFPEIDEGSTRAAHPAHDSGPGPTGMRTYVYFVECDNTLLDASGTSIGERDKCGSMKAPLPWTSRDLSQALDAHACPGLNAHCYVVRHLVAIRRSSCAW